MLSVGWMWKPSVLQQSPWDSPSLSRGPQPGLLEHHGKHTRGWTPNPGVQPQLCGQLGCGPGITLPSLPQVRTLREAPLLFTSSWHFLQEGPFDDPHGPLVLEPPAPLRWPSNVCQAFELAHTGLKPLVLPQSWLCSPLGISASTPCSRSLRSNVSPLLPFLSHPSGSAASPPLPPHERSGSGTVDLRHVLLPL